MGLTAGSRLGPYEILSAIGSGGMGEVYRAKDTRLDRTVAIKILPREVASDPARRERFEREARAVSSLNHPHICALHDVGRHDGIEFLVMEDCQGETLADRLAKRPLRFDQVLRYAIEVAGALDAAHRQGITHRDLKPTNIMLTATGAKLLDFGVAKWRKPLLSDAQPSTLADSDHTLTADGAIVGTLNYMAPEQLDGRDADARTDIFAFGAVLYEMAAGRKAFEGKSQASVMAAILEHEPLPMSPLGLQETIPPAFERIVRKCLAKDPEERWQSVRDLATELKWIAEGRATPMVTAGITRPGGRERVAWIAAAVFCVVATFATAALIIGYVRRGAVTESATAFVVLPPEGTTLSPSASLLAVSPDGRSLSFLAASSDGTTHLWVRALDSLAARELPGTDGALGPFWSWDSRHLGFFAGGKLKKIDILGGPPVALCAAQAATPHGTWNREGIILFSDRTARGSGLFRVSAAGGRPTAVIPDAGPVEASRRVLPQFLPDGRHFLYSVRSGQDWSGIYVGSLESRDSTRLLSVNSQALYASPGFLVFHRDGTLFAQHFDAATRKFTGEPLPIRVERVGYNPAGGGGRGMFSVSQNGVLVYRAAPTTQLMWLDRTGRSLGTIGAPASDWTPALSPDGKRIAVSRFDPLDGTRNIWIIESPGGRAARLTQQSAGGVSPVWSPDGSRIAFTTGWEAPFDLRQKALSGTTDEELVIRDAGLPLDWSGDGRFIIYGRDGDLWVLPLAGPREPAPLLSTQFSERHGQLSPDGRWLAYSSDQSGRYEVYVRPFPAGEGEWPISVGGGIEPRWRRDGNELFYLASDQDLVAVPVKSGSTFEAGKPATLFRTRADGSGRLGIVGTNQYVVSADGQRFLVNQQPPDAPPPPITVILNWTSVLAR